MNIYDVLDTVVDALPITPRMAYDMAKAVQGEPIPPDEYAAIITAVKVSGARLQIAARTTPEGYKVIGTMVMGMYSPHEGLA
jgi:hypothetical protein